MMTHEFFAKQGAALPPGLDLEIFRMALVIGAIAMGVFGLVLIILGVFVIRGSRGAIITSIVLNILAIVFQLANMIMQFAGGAGVAGAGGGAGNPAMGGVLNLIVAGILIWLVIWLFQANSAAGQLRDAGAAAQMYAYQQSYGAMYGGQQYGQQYGQGQGSGQAQAWPNQPQWGAQQQQERPPPQQSQQSPPPPSPPPSDPPV
jgi:hypothetical protein